MKYPMFKVCMNIEPSLKNLDQVLRSGFLNEGESVIKLKNNLESYLNIDQVVMTNSCTSALTMALKLSGVVPGDEVITTSMTCLATNTPILNLNALPVWADIDSDTGCISYQSILKNITSKTKAVICVDWAGNPCDLKKLDNLCKDKGIKLIQDAAHAFGSSIDKKCISQYSDYTCFSFQAIKHLTTGDGGAIVCRDEKDYNRASRMKWFGLDRNTAKNSKGEWKGQRWEIDVEEAGYKFHMNNIAAAIGLANLKSVDEKVSIHMRNGHLYNKIFKDCKRIKLLKMPTGSSSSYWVYTLMTDLGKEKRDSVIKKLNELQINAGLVHIPNHFYHCFKDSYKELPNVDIFASNQISLPCGSWLSEEDVSFIGSSVIKLIGDI